MPVIERKFDVYAMTHQRELANQFRLRE